MERNVSDEWERYYRDEQPMKSRVVPAPAPAAVTQQRTADRQRMQSQGLTGSAKAFLTLAAIGLGLVLVVVGARQFIANANSESGTDSGTFGGLFIVLLGLMTLVSPLVAWIAHQVRKGAAWAREQQRLRAIEQQRLAAEREAMLAQMTPVQQYVFLQQERIEAEMRGTRQATQMIGYGLAAFGAYELRKDHDAKVRERKQRLYDSAMGYSGGLTGRRRF